MSWRKHSITRKDLHWWESDNNSIVYSSGSNVTEDITPQNSYTAEDGDELVEISLNIEDSDSIILHSIEMVPSSSSSSGIRRTSSSKTRTRHAESETGVINRVKRSLSAQLAKRFSGKLNDSASMKMKDDSVVVDPAIAVRVKRKHVGQLNRTRSSAQRALKCLKFINDKGNNVTTWGKVKANFNRLARDEFRFLYCEDFAECIGMGKSKDFALALFDALSRRRRLKVDKISLGELEEYWTCIVNPSFDSRLQLFFQMVDKNGKGYLTVVEVEEVIRLSAAANGLKRLEEQAGEYAALIMEELDPVGHGCIELDQLETLLLQNDAYMSSVTFTAHTSRALTKDLQRPRKKTRMQKIRTNIQANWKRIWVLSVWILVMIGLFVWKFLQYRHKDAFKVMSYCLTTAKGAAETLKLNMALILFPVCRNTITWLRSTWLAYTIPFDDNIIFHKTIAVAIVLGVVVHAGNHLACDFVRLERSSPEDYARYLSRDFGIPKPTYGDLVRGVEGTTGIIMVILMTIAFTLATYHFVRRGKVKPRKPSDESAGYFARLQGFFDRVIGFNAFYYSHHLLIIVYICLFIHGIQLYLVREWYKKTTWMYLAVPVMLYVGERTFRFFRSNLYSTRLLKVAIYPGNVLALQMSKPPKFRYKSGQYMFVKCPAISSFERHPFSITSAPGDDFLGVHIRNNGDWTKEILEKFKPICQTLGDSGVIRPNETTLKSLPKLMIDGPYGAPAQNYRKYDILLLVGLGIGATPFISILKDLINNVITRDEEKDVDLYPIPNFNYKDSTKQKKALMTTKAYFYWVTQEQGSFDWFKGIMNEVSELDHNEVIEMHNHLTSVYEEGDARSALITMVAALNHAKNGVDVVSGYKKVRTHFARPNWKKVISKICCNHPNARVGVFYCGPEIAALQLKLECSEQNLKGTTKFEFHKENF